MKLKNYFTKQKKIYLSEIEKIQILGQINSKLYKKSLLSKKSIFSIKSVLYGSFIVLILFGTYGSWSINNNKNNDAFFVRHLSNINSAQAGFVAKIIDFDGNFYIDKNGKHLQTNNIGNNDIVVLETGTKLVFYIDGKTQATISGPAKFVINKSIINNQDYYQLNLEYYNNIVDIISLKGKSSQNLEVKIPEITINSIKSIVPIKFQIIKTKDKQLIRNEGSKLTIIKNNGKTNNIDKITQIKGEQLASVGEDDISIMTIKEFDSAIKSNYISQTFKITKNDTNQTENIIVITNQPIENNISTTINTDNLLNQNSELKLNTGVLEQLSGILLTKKILTQEENISLRANLNSTFLTNDMKQLFTSRIKDNTNLFNLIYNKIEKKIVALYKSFELTYSYSNGNPEIIKQNIDKLISYINQQYEIPPRYINNLNNIKNAFTVIYTKKIGENIDIELERNKIINSGIIKFQ